MGQKKKKQNKTNEKQKMSLLLRSGNDRWSMSCLVLFRHMLKIHKQIMFGPSSQPNLSSISIMSSVKNKIWKRTLLNHVITNWPACRTLLITFHWSSLPDLCEASL